MVARKLYIFILFYEIVVHINQNPKMHISSVIPENLVTECLSIRSKQALKERTANCNDLYLC